MAILLSRAQTTAAVETLQIAAIQATAKIAVASQLEWFMENSKPTTEQIWRALSDQLRRFVLPRVKDSSDADDIVQNVFLKIHNKLESLKTNDRLEAWVFQIARNVIIDHYRSRPKKESQLTTEAVDVDGGITIAERQNDSTGQDFNQQIAGCIKELIDQLPGDQRRAVGMYELQGVSQQEIADTESISLSGAKSRVQRGRKALVGLLNDCCKFDLDRRGNIIGVQSSNGCDSGSGDSCDCS